MKWHIICIVAFVFNIGNAQKVIFQNVTNDIKNNVWIYLFQGPELNDRVKIKLEDGLTFSNYNFFNASSNTTFYFHGWKESILSESVNTVASAFLQKRVGNVIVFDYSVLVKGDLSGEYIPAVKNASYIGKAIGQYLQQYTQQVQSKDLLHLVSHSLGSQVMSQAARTYGSGLLPWLTGLDPAGPIFNLPTVDHLSASDGIFVDIIHTDGGFYGDFRTIGTVDFFPDRGTRIQPHCYYNPTDIFCDHHMSWRYYAASIINSTDFPALRCKRTAMCDSTLFLCDCDDYNGEFTYIGLNINKKAKGTFYLDVAFNAPYGKGVTGMDF